MRRFVRPPRLVHFSASSRPKHRKPPLEESSASSTRLPPPSTSEGQSLCHRENCPAHGTLTQKDALWLFSLRPWAAAICRRLGLRGQDVEDATQSAFTSALSSWALFHHNEELPLLEQRRCWFAAIVWRCASKLRYRRDRQRHVERRGAARASYLRASPLTSAESQHARFSASSPTPPLRSDGASGRPTGSTASPSKTSRSSRGGPSEPSTIFCGSLGRTSFRPFGEKRRRRAVRS